MLATIALCVATTILVKMHRARYMWVTCLPLSWLVIVTFTASYEKIFSPLPRIGFLAQASGLEAAVQAGTVAAARIAETQILIFNARLDAFHLRCIRNPGGNDSDRFHPGLDGNSQGDALGGCG